VWALTSLRTSRREQLRRGKANAEQSRRPPFSLRGNCSPLTPSGLGGGKSGAFQAGIAQGEKLALKILRARFSCIIERVGANSPSDE